MTRPRSMVWITGRYHWEDILRTHRWRPLHAAPLLKCPKDMELEQHLGYDPGSPGQSAIVARSSIIASRLDNLRLSLDHRPSFLDHGCPHGRPCLLDSCLAELRRAAPPFVVGW